MLHDQCPVGVQHGLVLRERIARREDHPEDLSHGQWLHEGDPRRCRIVEYSR